MPDGVSSLYVCLSVCHSIFPCLLLVSLLYHILWEDMDYYLFLFSTLFCSTHIHTYIHIQYVGIKSAGTNSMKRSSLWIGNQPECIDHYFTYSHRNNFYPPAFFSTSSTSPPSPRTMDRGGFTEQVQETCLYRHPSLV